ncbi:MULTISPECIES: hypothetical protein [Streptomyces]|uniref:hypothetical protein n=1 Tax=Streptomyces TaxID=1883 RepID=UPI0031DEA74A
MLLLLRFLLMIAAGDTAQVHLARQFAVGGPRATIKRNARNRIAKSAAFRR